MKSIAWGIGLLAVGVIWLLFAGAREAGANGVCDDFPYASESVLINSGCRENAIDPGIGEVHDNESLYNSASRFILNANGFDDQWLWYAPLQTRTFTTSGSERWAFCDTYVGAPGDFFTYGGYVCPSGPGGTMGAKLGFTDVIDSFSVSSVDLRVLQYEGGFISIGCGNFSEARPTEDPVPHIFARKFRDDNRNGRMDAGEPWRAGVTFEIHRVQSEIGQPLQRVAVLTTNAQGRIDFALDGHGPGRYEVREIVPAGSIPTTATTVPVTVDWGVGDREYNAGLFGNAPDSADVEKVSFELVAPPVALEARMPATVTVRAVVRNNGPGRHVRVRETLTASGPDDCTIDIDRPGREFDLDVGESRDVDFDVTIECDLPSFHEFSFENELTLIEPRLRDQDPTNNTASFDWTVPVFADADLSVGDIDLDCDASPEVGEDFTCTLTASAVNGGPYGPVDATAILRIQQDGATDCSFDPALPVDVDVDNLDVGSPAPLESSWTVQCSHRSFHDFTASASLTADDIHVVDTPTDNNTGSITDRVEVFHDAELSVTDIVIVCDETDGASSFQCSVDVDVVNGGPAELVSTTTTASIETPADCSVTPTATQQTAAVLQIGATTTHTFDWVVTCTETSMLHPVRITADVAPTNEPHAVDEPGEVVDDWGVPYCMPTVNPAGKKQPAAPGNGGQGQNQDGFYVFGAKTLDGSLDVWIEDDGSGVVFGPFSSGVRIKWVEANGATPTISPMGGNNGGGGSAVAVDHQIRARGDAVALYYDEDGNVIRSHCRVPPAPK